MKLPELGTDEKAKRKGSKNLNTFSNLMETVFTINEEKQTNSTKNSSKNIVISLNGKTSLVKKGNSKSLPKTNENKLRSQEHSIVNLKERSGKSVEEKELNQFFFLEEFFDCSCDQCDTKYSNVEYELQLVKKNEDIRKSYITKLMYNKVWEPINKPKQHNTLIIFDWDDTLLCTSHLTLNGVYNENIRYTEKDYENLSKIEENVIKLMKLAISKGDTYIITNAAPGWVEYSTRKFYPKVIEILSSVKIISARGKYEKEYPNDSKMWKVQAFLEMQKNFNQDLVTNIICLGDSLIEMEAAQILATKFSQAYIKTIKFKEIPKPEELNKQLLLVIDQFNTIYSSVKNLTIRVEKKSKSEK